MRGADSECSRADQKRVAPRSFKCEASRVLNGRAAKRFEAKALSPGRAARRNRCGTCAALWRLTRRYTTPDRDGDCPRPDDGGRGSVYAQARAKTIEQHRRAPCKLPPLGVASIRHATTRRHAAQGDARKAKLGRWRP